VDFLLGKALDDLRVSAPRHTAVDFDRPGEQRLVRRTAASRVVVGARRGNGCLVRLNNAVLRLAIWINNGPAQLGTLHPGGLVGTQAEQALQLQGPRCRWKAWAPETPPRSRW
jgi:hypothetical protein